MSTDNNGAFPPREDFPNVYDRIAVVAEGDLRATGPVPAQAVILPKGEPPPKETSFVINIAMKLVEIKKGSSPLGAFFILPWMCNGKDCLLLNGRIDEVEEEFEKCVSNIRSRASREVKRVAVMASMAKGEQVVQVVQVVHLRLLQGQSDPISIIGEREKERWGER